MELPFAWVRGDRAYVSGHTAFSTRTAHLPDRSGRWEMEVSPEERYEAARLTALSVLGGLKRELGDLDRVSAWLVVNGLINAAPGFGGTTNVINGFSEVILSLYGSEAGMHAHTAIGASALTLDLPVTIAAEVEING